MVVVGLVFLSLYFYLFFCIRTRSRCARSFSLVLFPFCSPLFFDCAVRDSSRLLFRLYLFDCNGTDKVGTCWAGCQFQALFSFFPPIFDMPSSAWKSATDFASFTSRKHFFLSFLPSPRCWCKTGTRTMTCMLFICVCVCATLKSWDFLELCGGRLHSRP